MSLENFYQLEKIDLQDPDDYTAYIRINKEHAIFKGHFPGKPVVPGVCMLQIIKEIVASVLKTKLTLKSSGNIKFTALIDPEKNPDLKLNISINRKDGNEIQVKNISYFGTTPAVKMNLNYILN